MLAAFGQEEHEELVPVRTCDALSRCFFTYTTDTGVSFGLALDANSTKAPFDVIVQLTAPKEVGWLGFAWGGSMTYNPLAIVWPNGNNVSITSRMGL
jgi:hypothetical protein